jgi:hypothetical protein
VHHPSQERETGTGPCWRRRRRQATDEGPKGSVKASLALLSRRRGMCVGVGGGVFLERMKVGGYTVVMAVGWRQRWLEGVHSAARWVHDQHRERRHRSSGSLHLRFFASFAST